MQGGEMVDGGTGVGDGGGLIDRVSRGRVLAGAAAMVGTACVGERFARAADVRPSLSKGQDVRILRLVLALEYTQVAFYEQALRVGRLRGDLRDFAGAALEHERQHLAAVRKALGSNAGSKPSFDFGPRTRSERAFQQAAITLEDVAVASYNGQATNLRAPTLAAAATIVSVEARHAAWIRTIAGELAARDPIDKPITAAEAAAALHAIGLRP